MTIGVVLERTSFLAPGMDDGCCTGGRCRV
jgi:hypothetical protein